MREVRGCDCDFRTGGGLRAAAHELGHLGAQMERRAREQLLALPVVAVVRERVEVAVGVGRHQAQRVAVDQELRAEHLGRPLRSQVNKYIHGHTDGVDPKLPFIATQTARF